ncbi:MAG: histidine phosphatase family protein [Aestuariibacter sp.]
MSVAIALIRHAQYQQLPDTPSALQPFPLTEEGEQVALSCGEELATFLKRSGRRFHPIIYCSASLRAWQTAFLIQRVLQKKLRVSIELAESADLCERSVGAVANLSAAKIEKIVAQDPRYAALPSGWKSDSYYCLPFPGAESLMQSGQRVASFIVDTLKTFSETSEELVIFVGHGASFRHAAYQMEILSFDSIAQLSMHHAKPVILERSQNGWINLHGRWKQRQLQSQFTD